MPTLTAAICYQKHYQNTQIVRTRKFGDIWWEFKIMNNKRTAERIGKIWGIWLKIA